MPRNIDMDTLLDADFRGPTMPWIDPLKEIHAEEKAVQAGFKSRSQVIRERGSNPATVNEQIKRERKDEDAAELVFTTNVGTLQEMKTNKNEY
jgi:capsid protein